MVTSSSTGEKFEEELKHYLKSNNFDNLNNKNNEILAETVAYLEKTSLIEAKQQLKLVKKTVLNKENCLEFLKNPFKKIRRNFIFQFNGSQNFPDFLLFCGDYLIPLEIKFSKFKKNNKEKSSFSKPKWNSNLPKSNSFYIYAKQNEDLVIFNGGDFINEKARIILESFFSDIDSKNNALLSEINVKLKNLNSDSNKFGLFPYIRKDFNYKKEFRSNLNQPEINIFELNRKNEWYQKVIDLIKNNF